MCSTILPVVELTRLVKNNGSLHSWNYVYVIQSQRDFNRLVEPINSSAASHDLLKQRGWGLLSCDSVPSNTDAPVVRPGSLFRLSARLAYHNYSNHGVREATGPVRFCRWGFVEVRLIHFFVL